MLCTLFFAGILLASGGGDREADELKTGNWMLLALNGATVGALVGGVAVESTVSHVTRVLCRAELSVVGRRIVDRQHERCCGHGNRGAGADEGGRPRCAARVVCLGM